MLNPIEDIIYQRQTHYGYRSTLQRFHIDGPILIAILSLLGFGLAILYSASNQSHAMMLKQIIRIAIGMMSLFLIAQIPPAKLRAFAPMFFGLTVFLLLVVMIRGEIGKGAQRWLDLGIIRFQPSELLKLSLPMMVASYLHDKTLPPSFRDFSYACLIIIIPGIMVAKQPDLGTAIVIMMVGAAVLVLSGLYWRIIFGIAAFIAAMIPVLWHFLHDYQRGRVLTFLYPESDPLGRGYHIIQSKIAIGSGGLFGKGWFKGTQSHLHFLPEHSTDFIFAVCGEEFGFVGCLLLLGCYVAILFRSLTIAVYAQDTFCRLLAGSLAISFFMSAFINIGMVMGILPVVGLPLPLVSYGGTSIVTSLATFGVLMSIHCHRKLLAR